MKNYVEPFLHESKRLRVGKEEIISYMEREDDQ